MVQVTNNNEAAVNEKKKNKRLRVAVIILSILLIGVAAYLTYNLLDLEEKTETISNLEVEQLQLTNDLQNMLIQYDTLTVQNDQLNAEILAQEEQIKEMLKLIEKHKDDAYIISKLKREAATLRDIMKGYLVTIDSLNTLNINLRTNNDSLNAKLTQVTGRAEELASSKKDLENIVAAGSVLQALDMYSVGIKVRNNGKQIDVDRASKTELIKTCTTIGENRIAPAGKTTIYLRIISPDGVVLDDAANTENRFNFNGVSGKYSVKRVIDYANEPLDLCIFYTVNSEIPTGQYIVEMYQGETLIGKTTFDLK